MKLVYYLILKPLSIVPFPVAYIIAKVLYFMIYKIARYRRKIVRENIAGCFPDYDQSTILAIEKAHYHYFCDILVESLLLFSISKKSILKHFKIVNSEILDPYFEQERDVILVLGHYNNWEMAAVACDMQLKHKLTVVYSALKNPFFNKKIKTTRSKYGTWLIDKNELSSIMNSNDRVPVLLSLVSDQSPTYSKRVYWTKFLNRDTAIFLGPEYNAVKYNATVAFAEIAMIKKGYYEMSFSIITDQPRKEKPGFITEEHTRRLENEILEKPEYWLWTHKRWKREKPSDWTEEGQFRMLKESLKRIADS